MTRWVTSPLGEIFEVARGGSPRPIQEFLTDDPNGLNWIMIGDTLAGSKYIKATKKRIRPEGLKKSRMVHEGDFLLTNSMSFGRPYILKTSGCIHDGWLVLSPRSNNVHSDFFYYLLGSETLHREFSRRAAGAVVKNLNTELVRNVEIPLPPLAEQKRIAAILDAADALRVKRRETIAQLDTLIQSTFLEMFGDPVTNPMGWEIANGTDICKRITVGIVVKPASYYQATGIPALRSLNIRANKIDASNMVYISKEDNENTLKKTKVKKGDVLLVRSGQPGTAAIVPDKMEGYNAIDILIATPNQSVVHPIYLCNYFNSSGGKRMALGAQRGQIQKHLNVGALKVAPIPIPPLDLQHRFATIVESIEQQKSRLNAHLIELDTLFASLQSRAFNGEL